MDKCNPNYENDDSVSNVKLVIGMLEPVFYMMAATWLKKIGVKNPVLRAALYS